MHIVGGVLIAFTPMWIIITSYVLSASVYEHVLKGFVYSKLRVTFNEKTNWPPVLCQPIVVYSPKAIIFNPIQVWLKL